MFAEIVIRRSKRCSSVFQPSKHFPRPNYQDCACVQSLNRSTITGNFSPSCSLARRLFSSKAAAPGSSFISLQWSNVASRLHSYSTYPTKEEKEPSGVRLNEKIQAQFVRLVSEEGHKIVPRHQALEQARKLNLDLVEVQGNVDPPVCKLMDFHKEKYKKQVKEKDRAKKSKSEVTLKSDCKEVRFSGKIEQKDLKMKADAVIRLLDRGYRVKCLVVPKGKELLDAEDMLSRISALVEDVALVESGPMIVEKKVEKKYGKQNEEDQEEKREVKHAFVILRHVKFGASKKGGAKKTKVIVTGEKVATEQPAVIFDEDPTESGLETEEDDEVDLPTPRIKMVNDALETPGPTIPVSQPEPENRYKRTEPKKPMEDKRPGIKLEPQFPNQRRPPPLYTNSQPGRENLEPQFPNQRRPPPLYTNSQPGRENFVPRILNTHPTQQEPHRTNRYRVPDKQGPPSEDVNKNDEGNRYKSAPRNPCQPNAPPGAQSEQPGVTGGGEQGKFGIFSRYKNSKQNT